MERAERARDWTRAMAAAGGAASGLWQALRMGVFELWVLIYSLGFGAAILLWFHHVRTPLLVRRILTAWTTLFIHSARAILGVRWRLEGREQVPDGPVLFIANHQTCWESIALTVFLPGINIVSKRGAMRIPVFGWGLRHAPMIPVDRDTPGRNIRRILRDGAASLRGGRSVLIFPEGTRVPVGGRAPYARGFERLYAAAGVPVVPIVTDAGHVWPKGLGAKGPGTITLRFLPPIPPGMGAEAFRLHIEELLNAEKERLPGAAR